MLLVDKSSWSTHCQAELLRCWGNPSNVDFCFLTVLVYFTVTVSSSDQQSLRTDFQCPKLIDSLFTKLFLHSTVYCIRSLFTLPECLISKCRKYLKAYFLSTTYSLVFWQIIHSCWKCIYFDCPVQIIPCTSKCLHSHLKVALLYQLPPNIMLLLYLQVLKSW